MNFPLAIPNNSTIFAHTILSYFSTPCPLSTRLGAFLFPRNIFPQIFSENFSNLPRRLFAVFLVRKIMGVEGAGRSPNGGGVPFCMLSLYSNRLLSTQSLPESSITPPGQKGIELGQKGAKSNIYLLGFVSPRENRRQQTAKY